MFKRKGFTLIELMVVITIIGVLSSIGFAVYTGVSSKAKEARKRADVDAIAKVTETKYDPLTGNYSQVQSADFDKGAIPTPPDGSSYDCIVGASGLGTSNCSVTSAKGFRICARLGNQSSTCLTNSSTCYCRSSQQGDVTNIIASSPVGACLSNTLSTGLIAYYNMDDNNFTQANGIKDQPGGRNLTKQGNTSQVTSDNSLGNFNKAASIGSANGDVLAQQTGNGIDSGTNTLGNNFTISAWIKPTSLSGSHWIFNNGVGVIFSVDNGALSAAIRTQRSRYNARGGSISNNWQQVALVYTDIQSGDSSNPFNLYINGNQVASGTTNEDYQNIPGQSQVYIGNKSYYIDSSHNQDAPFNGSIDEVRIYNRVLTQNELSALSSACVP